MIGSCMPSQHPIGVGPENFDHFPTKRVKPIMYRSRFGYKLCIVRTE